MGEEIRKFDERIAEFKKQKAEFEEEERQFKAVEAELPRELRESIAESSDRLVDAGLRLKELKYKLFECLKKVREDHSEKVFRAVIAYYDIDIGDMGGVYHKSTAIRGREISGAVNLDAIEEWGTKEENVWEFLEKVKWDILVANPNKFVTIKEIAKTLNWQFEGDTTVLHFLCLPLYFSPEIKIEEQENEEHSLVAYKYIPDAQVGGSAMPRQESYYSFRSFIEMLIEQDSHRWGIRNRNMAAYYSCIKKVAEIFWKIKFDRENEPRYRRDDKFDENTRKLKEKHREYLRSYGEW